jgi:hypothetical protein
MFSIQSALRSSGNTMYYEPGFRKVIEDHVPWLISRSKGRILTVPKTDLVKHQNDLSGFLNASNISPDQHWVIMRVNNMVSNADFDGTVTELMIPDTRDLEDLRRRYMSTYNV